jgi:hypothetical protein
MSLIDACPAAAQPRQIKRHGQYQTSTRAISPPPSRTGSEAATSGHGPGSSISPSCATPSATGLLVGQWRGLEEPTWARRSRHNSRAAPARRYHTISVTADPALVAALAVQSLYRYLSLYILVILCYMALTWLCAQAHPGIKA